MVANNESHDYPTGCPQAGRPGAFGVFFLEGNVGIVEI